MFLYNAEVVLLGSCSRFPEVPLVQRAALRAFLDGSRVDSTKDHHHSFFFFFQPLFLPDFSILSNFCFVWPSHQPVLRTSHSTAPHQTLGKCSPYPYPPTCTPLVHVAPWLLPQKPSLHPAHSLFLFPQGTGTGVLTAVEGSFVLCLLVQVTPNLHYTPALQLCWHFSPFLFVFRQVNASLHPPSFGSKQQKTKTRCYINSFCPGFTASL